MSLGTAAAPGPSSPTCPWAGAGSAESAPPRRKGDSQVTDIALYRQLFVHRSDVFARQLESGAYVPQRRDLTDDDIEEHLAGFWSIGTYVIDPEGQTVKYVCFDLDTHDEAATELLCGLVEELVTGLEPGPHGKYALLKEWSGNKGTHVWLFLSEPVEAAKVRRWIGRDFLPKWIEATGGSVLEIFPKQDTVPEGGFGNLVKLPLGKHAVSGNFSKFLPFQGWASSIEEVVPLDATLIPDVAPDSETASRRAGRSTHGGNQPSSPFPCVDQVLYKGAGQGQRNQAMFHLALYCYGHAVPEDLALEMCQRANEEFDPPMPDREVTGIIDQAYSGRYVSARCGSDWLRGFCEGPCRAGWQVLSEEPEHGTLRSANEGSLVEVQVVRKSTDAGRTRLTIGHPDASNQPTLICD